MMEGLEEKTSGTLYIILTNNLNMVYTSTTQIIIRGDMVLG
jgi:hypothetical protein